MPCFHCGLPCPDDRHAADGRSFCCFGCETVFSLLHENGLGQYYTLASAPGARIREISGLDRWIFLNDPVVQEKLLDFAGERQARVTLHLPTIHCVACVWLLENLFKLHPGIGRSQVNFSRREAAITFAPEQIKLGELAALLTSIGYEPALSLGALEKSKPSVLKRRQWLQIGLAGFAFGNIMLMSLPGYFGLDSVNAAWFKILSGAVSLALALPVVTYSASDFWRNAWLSLRRRALSLDVPIVLGLIAIYSQSAFDVITGRGPGYCDSLAGLIFFLLCGRLFQQKTHERLVFDRDYKAFFPLSAVRKTAAGSETVAISRLKTGDHLVLRNGELLPADSRLISGNACIDYSFVSGESEPVSCPAGARLYAGGRQAGGSIEVEIVKPVEQSYLASLWNNEAFKKATDPLESLTNLYSRRFTAVVIGFALAAAVFWAVHDSSRALRAFTSVLIVACPCALALAAPLTQGTAQRILAGWKIFLRNGSVLERLAAVDTIVLDKTGTLTRTDYGLVEFVGPEPLNPDEAAWIASLSRQSTHPKSIQLAEFLGAEKRPVSNFKEFIGGGIGGSVDGHEILVGSRAWLQTNGVRILGSNVPANSVEVAVDGQFRCGFSIANALRLEVERLLEQLGDRYELVLLSGDNDRESLRFGKLFGSRATLRFHQTPENKLNFIRGLQSAGRKVMMVGDGLNDAGALKQSDVGVAVVEEIGIFSPASDVILDAAELPRLMNVLRFSKSAGRIVRAGFLISGLYNVVGISIAAAGLLSPVVCAILMPLSSVTMVIFTCGLTAWSGRKLKAEKLSIETPNQAIPQLPAFNAPLIPREAA